VDASYRIDKVLAPKSWGSLIDINEVGFPEFHMHTNWGYSNQIWRMDRENNIEAIARGNGPLYDALAELADPLREILNADNHLVTKSEGKSPDQSIELRIVFHFDRT